MESSNVTIKSNLMAKERLRPREPHYLYMPGDLVFQMYKEHGYPILSGVMLEQILTKKQVNEYRQKLICRRCHRACAGTCETEGAKAPKWQTLKGTGTYFGEE